MMENKNFNKEIKFGNHIQIKRGSGSPQGAKDSFKVGELGYDLTNNDLYIRAESDMVRIGSNIVDTATANSKDLITSHGVSVIKNQIDSDISNLENEFDNLKKSLIDLMFPVGTVITNASSTFDPNKVYQGTTWTRIKGKVVVGVDESDTPFNKTNKTGGNKFLQGLKLTGTTGTGGDHNHSINSISLQYSGEHNGHYNLYNCYEFGFTRGFAAGGNYNGRVVIGGTSDNTVLYDHEQGSHSHDVSTSTLSKGGSHAHSINMEVNTTETPVNLQPYITKYVWERTA